MDSLGSWVQSQLMSKLYKCCSMLCEVFFSLFERPSWGCALSWSLATPNLKTIWNSGKFLREGHIHTKDSSVSTIRKKKCLLFEVSIIWCKTVSILWLQKRYENLMKKGYSWLQKSSKKFDLNFLNLKTDFPTLTPKNLLIKFMPKIDSSKNF
jgi:hypothetical protein